MSIKKKITVEQVYPITIIHARYGGVYEGGKYVCFNKRPEEIPEEATSDDITCMDWWENVNWIIGKGRTPDKALQDLVDKLNTI